MYYSRLRWTESKLVSFATIVWGARLQRSCTQYPYCGISSKRILSNLVSCPCSSPGRNAASGLHKKWNEVSCPRVGVESLARPSRCFSPGLDFSVEKVVLSWWTTFCVNLQETLTRAGHSNTIGWQDSKQEPFGPTRAWKIMTDHLAAIPTGVISQHCCIWAGALRVPLSCIPSIVFSHSLVAIFLGEELRLLGNFSVSEPEFCGYHWVVYWAPSFL